MRLANLIFETPIEFKENFVNVLVVENQKCLSKIIQQLYYCLNNDDGEFILTDNLKNIKISKYVDVIFDCFSLDINNRKALNKLYQELERLANENELYIETTELLQKIYTYVDDLISEVDYFVEYAEVSISEFIKVCNIKFDDSSTNLLEKVCNYLSVMSRLLDIKLFVFVNLKSFLDKEEVIQLYKFLSYEKIVVLLIENYEHYRLPNEIVKIIDKDLCEI